MREKLERGLLFMIAWTVVSLSFMLVTLATRPDVASGFLQ